jgi:hypothetical protein
MTPDSTSSACDGDVAALDVHIRVVDIDLAGGFSTVIRIDVSTTTTRLGMYSR